ncbi:MAG: tRNA (adenosine(37)-N6)-threonylcarbamoyltransferase complex dimerization subunit type 1 TsaB [Mycoplasmatales bacterium]
MNLFINTTTAKVEIFYFTKDYQKLYTKLSQNNHTLILYQLFEELLQAEDITMQQLQKIYIINGPGSYTGTRVGVVFAKTIAHQLQLPIYPLGLLDTLYLTNNKKACVDARGGKYFCYDGQEYQLLLKEEALKQNYELEQNINYDILLSILKYLIPCEVKKVKINYMKEAI